MENKKVLTLSFKIGISISLKMRRGPSSLYFYLGDNTFVIE